MITRTSVSDDREFIQEVISSSLLEDAINFIKAKYTAEDIFGEEALKEWAEDNGYIKEE